MSPFKHEVSHIQGLSLICNGFRVKKTNLVLFSPAEVKSKHFTEIMPLENEHMSKERKISVLALGLIGLFAHFRLEVFSLMNPCQVFALQSKLERLPTGSALYLHLQIKSSFHFNNLNNHLTLIIEGQLTHK